MRAALRPWREGIALVRARLPQPQQVNMGGAETGCRPTPTSEGERSLHSANESAIRGNTEKRPKDFPVLRSAPWEEEGVPVPSAPPGVRETSV
jgi:hypothetical protein